MNLFKIRNTEDLEESGIQAGDSLHVGVVGPGQSTNDAQFVRRMVKKNQVTGVVLSIRGQETELPWADIVELWPLPCHLCLSEPQKSYKIDEFQKKINGS